MRYIPALDGLRAIAVMVVVAFHSRVPGMSGGFLGVDVFFVLSGFLITSLLMAEIDDTGTVQIWRFYLRRLVRLTPALLFFLSIFVLVAPLIWPRGTTYLSNALMAALYLGDLGDLFWNKPLYGVGHTWSLAIEMHFYLIWPLLFLWLRTLSRQQILIVLVAAYLAATAWRLHCLANGDSWKEIYFLFDTRVSGLILGSALAVLWSLPHRIRIPGAAAGVAYAILILMVYESGWGLRVVLGHGIILTELATAVIIAHALGGSARWLEQPAMVYIGKLSYGIYLFHKPASTYLRARYGWDTTFLGAAAVGIVGAAVSYHTIERYARKWRAKRRQLATCGA